MRRMFHALTAVAALFALNGAARAQPLSATFTGFLSGTADPFTATFRYDTEDLQPSPYAPGFFNAAGGTLQSISYTDPFRTLTLTTPGSFSEGRYDSAIYDEDGTLVKVDSVTAYALSSSAGMASLSFGGVNNGGIVTFDSDGLAYALLETSSFTLSTDAVATVPIPSSGVLLVGGLALFGLMQRRLEFCSRCIMKSCAKTGLGGAAPGRSTGRPGPHAVGENAKATPLMQ